MEMKAAKRIQKELKKKERSEERKNAKTRRSKDGTWAVKNKKAHFGHKLHTSQTIEHDITANYAVTTATVHDSQIDLSIPGIVNYKDKEYLGVEGKGVNAEMWHRRVMTGSITLYSAQACGTTCSISADHRIVSHTRY
jgi:IS5 family transposase